MPQATVHLPNSSDTALDLRQTSDGETHLSYVIPHKSGHGFFEITGIIRDSGETPLAIARAFKEAFAELERTLTSSRAAAPVAGAKPPELTC